MSTVAKDFSKEGVEFSIRFTLPVHGSLRPPLISVLSDLSQSLIQPGLMLLAKNDWSKWLDKCQRELLAKVVARLPRVGWHPLASSKCRIRFHRWLMALLGNSCHRPFMADSSERPWCCNLCSACMYSAHSDWCPTSCTLVACHMVASTSCGTRTSQLWHCHPEGHRLDLAAPQADLHSDLCETAWSGRALAWRSAAISFGQAGWLWMARIS